MTFEYQANGIATEGYSLSLGNTQPRGAASTAAGDKLWVADVNKNVYVYDTAGKTLGSWSAGSLSSTAQVEGITTNGTDVWIVDNKTDKVFKYAGAASRLGGSQTAISSFPLNSANSNPKDLVTDGTSIWVINDGYTDKVFKYTLSGTLVSSWTVSTPGAWSPTGITLDPSNPAHLWIVDNVSDKVYQYSNTVNQANGSSKSADASFSLATAAGNTNPQGIADPPPPSAFNSPGRTPELQSPFAGSAPMPWFSSAANNVGPATLQNAQAKVRSTDEWMSVLGLAFEQPKFSVNADRMTMNMSDKTMDGTSGFEALMQDDNIDDLIGLVATDLSRPVSAPKLH